MCAIKMAIFVEKTRSEPEDNLFMSCSLAVKRVAWPSKIYDRVSMLCFCSLLLWCRNLGFIGCCRVSRLTSKAAACQTVFVLSSSLLTLLPSTCQCSSVSLCIMKFALTKEAVRWFLGVVRCGGRYVWLLWLWASAVSLWPHLSRAFYRNEVASAAREWVVFPLCCHSAHVIRQVWLRREASLTFKAPTEKTRQSGSSEISVDSCRRTPNKIQR